MWKLLEARAYSFSSLVPYTLSSLSLSSSAVLPSPAVPELFRGLTALPLTTRGSLPLPLLPPRSSLLLLLSLYNRRRKEYWRGRFLFGTYGALGGKAAQESVSQPLTT